MDCHIYKKMADRDEFNRFQFYVKRTVYRYFSQYYIDRFAIFRKKLIVNYRLCENMTKEYMDGVLRRFCTWYFDANILKLLNEQLMQRLVNQLIVLIFSNRLPGMQDSWMPVPLRDDFIQKTVEELKSYEQPPQLSSFEIVWMVKHRYKNHLEEKLLRNPVNSFLFYHFASSSRAAKFIKNRVGNIKSNIKKTMTIEEQSEYKVHKKRCLRIQIDELKAQSFRHLQHFLHTEAVKLK